MAYIKRKHEQLKCAIPLPEFQLPSEAIDTSIGAEARKLRFNLIGIADCAMSKWIEFNDAELEALTNRNDCYLGCQL